MHIVIDILEEEYQGILNDAEVLPKSLTHYEKIIKNGIPLPKGHGRLIDADELKKLIQEKDVLHMAGFSVRICDINDTPSIIEADEIESEEK